MIAAHHPLVGPQPAAGAARRRMPRRRRPVTPCGTAAARCHPRPLRHPGHRLHRISRPGAAGGRGPGHLSADHGAARRAASRAVRGFSFFGVSFVYIIFEDGTDIYWARSRVLEYLELRPSQAAGRDHAVLGPGRDRRRLGLSVRRAGRATAPGRAALAAGLVRALRGWPRRPASPRWRASAASCSNTRSSSIRCGCVPTACRSGRSSTPSAPATRMSAAAPSRWPRPSTWCAAAAISRASMISSRSCSRPRPARRCCMRDVARVELGPDERRGVSELERRGRGGRRHCAAALRRERSRGHRQRQGARSPRSRTGLPEGVRSRRSTTARS